MVLGFPSVLAVFALLQQPAPPVLAVGGDAVSYQAPGGWSRRYDPRNHVTYLTPPGVALGRTCVIGVFAPQIYNGSAEAYHELMVNVAAYGARQVDVPRRGTEGPFLATALKQRGVIGPVNFVTVFTVRWSDRGQTIVFSTNAEDLAAAYFPVAQAFVRGAVVPQGGAPVVAGAPAAQPPGISPAGRRHDPNAWHPKPVPTGDRVVAIKGAYISTGATTSYSVDPSDAGVKSRVGTTMLVLYANGVAVRSAVVKANRIDDTYYAEGFATVDPNDVSSLGDRQWGRWTERGGTISIAWKIGGAQALARDGESLKEAYARWTPYASVDGLELEGQFGHVLPFGPPMVLVLHRDGTFSEDRVNDTMGGAIVNEEFPEHGSGRYEITRWSLVLRFSSGFVQSINLLLGGGDPANVNTFVLNGYDFTRATR